MFLFAHSACYVLPFLCDQENAARAAVTEEVDMGGDDDDDDDQSVQMSDSQSEGDEWGGGR